ncbi:alpha/beta hydrolase-fold protein [Pollutibacter soli]|uniref:alpha/beta hydrolase-fold protein n=1 Tax=Pollutibacter soli TaxID=3034157 RepID=UPI003013F6B0
MKKLLIVLVLHLSMRVEAQDIEKQAPAGFDSLVANVPHGRIDTITYPSKTVGVNRRAIVYTPPGFSKSKKYPVLYLLHGIGGDEKEWFTNAKPQNIFDNLYAKGRIEPMIVVMPNGRAMKDDRAGGNIFDSAKVKAFSTFEQDLINDLIPFTEKKYPVIKDRQHRAIAGLSMGGGQTLNFGLGHPEMFAWVGGFSSAPNTKAPELLVPDPAKTKQSNQLIWISCGIDDGLIGFSQRTHEYLQKHDIPHIYYVEPGAHDFKVWKNDLYMFSQLLFKTPDPSLFQKYSVLGTPATTNVRNAKYPQVLPDSRVIFRLKAPEAQKVQIDLGKKYNMAKDTGGYWQVITDSISEGFHYYSLLIDGVAVADPASESFYGMGRMASGIEIPFVGGDYYAVRDVPHGVIEQKRYFSPVTNSWRRMFVYTPPGYNENSGSRFPVLYILHGGGEDERGWGMQGKTDMIIDNLIAEGKAKPMIVVMMDGNLGAGGLAGFGERNLMLFENELKRGVIPYVEKNFRAANTGDQRALAGLSMGGLQTLHAGVRNTDMFSYLGVFSSGWFANRTDITNPQYEYMKNNATTINKNVKSFWISMGGKEDIAYNNCKVMMAKFDELGIKYVYTEYPGGHTWPVWRNNLYNFAQLLFK